MFSKFLCTDVLAICCVDDLIFVGMGCALHIFNVSTYKLEKKINSNYPYNIHGIVKGPNNKITVFGANSFSTYKIYRNQGMLTIEEDSNKKILNDWIVAAKWLTYDECNYLCVLLAHNNVCMYNTFGECYQTTWCEEKCILYGGSILNNNNKNLIIFSGTVYQEILIWEVNYTYHNETSIVLHRLQGHNGVIFSVIYDQLSQLICSTSDDRTIRLWKISNKKHNDIVTNWKEVNIRLMRTMFGHTARVWKSIIRNKILITIGEDSLMCIWSLDGELLNKIYAHHGAAIWSIDVSVDNKHIFTGGADGAVHAWPFINDHIQKAVLLPKTYTHIMPKYVCYLSSGNLLVFNENGTLFMFDRWHNTLREALYLERYSTYCIMEVSLCHSYVCFASRDGYLTIYQEAEDMADKKLQQIVEEKIMESRIFSVQWLENNKLVICGTNGVLKIFGFTIGGSFTIQSVCILPHSRERWLTAAVLYKGLLVCGDRAGNMHAFDFEKSISRNKANVPQTDNKPIQTFVKVHGRIGIQSFIVLNSKLISTGRDATLRFYELNDNTKLLNILHKQKMPMDWISGHLKSFDDTFVLGFKEVDFIIYSMFHHRTLIRIPCGGGHRSWDCILLNNFITFLYIRNKQVYVSSFSLNSLTSPVLLAGFHTKEIYSIYPVLKSDQYNIFMSGSEDGTLRINYISSISTKNDLTFGTLNIFDGHISSIKFITCMYLESNLSYKKYLTFSGGGRAQIKVWEIDIRNGKTLLQSTDVSCHDISSHMLYGFDCHRKKQWQESNRSYNIQPETRYMDIESYRCRTNLHYILLFVACADGFVRIFLYDINIKSISLKAYAKCVDRCIAKITVLTYDEKIIVLTMSTDGIGRFTDFTDIILKIIKFPQHEVQEFQNCNDTCIAKFNLHQSGITSYDIKAIEKGEYLLATGGDDNLFNLIHFKVQLLNKEEKLHIALLSKWNSSTIHVAQITGIIFHEESKIFSVGVDQQVIMYHYDFNNNAISVTVLKKIFTSVTDVKGLTSWHNPKGESIVCVYGKGFEILIS